MPEHKNYIEVCAGGAALFFAKEKSSFEVLNDLNSGLVNFYRVLRQPEKFDRFHFLVSLMPFSREEYYNCRDTWQQCEDDVERAARWFLVARQSFSANFGRAWAIEKRAGSHFGLSTSAAPYLSAIDRLPEVFRRLMGVQIEHDDFRKILKAYDEPDSFFYLDPPYVSDTRRSKKVYTHEMTNEDHEELVEMLLCIKGKAMLSGYWHPVYGPLECAGWKRHDFDWHCSAAARTKRSGLIGQGAATESQKRIESVWLKNW